MPRAGLAQQAGANTTAAPVRYEGYAALCVVARDENRYVREWVDYHKCLGFSRIYLYDHDSAVPLSAQLGEHIASGFVNYTHFSGHHKHYSRKHRPTSLSLFTRTAQGYAYKKCVKAHGRKHTFLGFIDVDEFLVFLAPNITHVEQLLRPFEPYGGLAVHWVVAGANNHTARPAGSVLGSYTTCMRRGIFNHRQFKTFANTAARPVMRNPHRPQLFKPSAVAHPFLVDDLRRRIKPGEANKPTHELAAVFHYVTKSWEDYAEKLRRGGGAGVRRDKAFFDMVQKRSRYTCTEPATLQARLCGAAGGGGGGGGGGVAGGAASAAALPAGV